MAKRAIVWTQTASLQRRDILKYWTLRNGSDKYAKKLIKLIASRINLIAKNPDAFKLTDFPDTRVSAMGHFSILYKTTDDLLIITGFWDNRQDFKKLTEILSKPETLKL